MGGSSCTAGDPYWRNVQVLEDGEGATTKNWAVPAMAVVLHGTPAPSSTTPQAQLASSVYNGTTDWTEIGVQADWEQGGTYALQDPFTIDIKFRASAVGTNMALVSNRSNLAKDANGPQGGIEVVVLADGRIYMGSYSTAVIADAAILPAGSIVANTNYNVRAVMAGGTMYIILNGSAIASKALSGIMHQGNLSMGLGARHTQGQPVDQFFAGRLEVRITNNVDRGHVAYTPDASWIAG